MPLFTWTPLAGNESYFVLVAKDPAFHTIVDYAFTQLPAYAPRSSSAATTYQDETTHYYWAVLPAVAFNGNLGSGDPLAARAADFQKLSVEPTLTAPDNGAQLTTPPTFEWTPTEGAMRYRLEVSQDSSFTTLLETVNTNATGYTSNTTYPSGATVYWRVRGEDARAQAMTWSDTATLQRPLPPPVAGPANSVAGDFVPTVTWPWVQGAVAYDVDVVQPTGTPRSFFARPPAGFTPSSISGIGDWKWRVRARFPAAIGQVQGPYMDFVSFPRSLAQPSGATTSAGSRHVLFEWQPDEGPGNGIKEYRVQTSAREDFTTVVQDERTQNTSYAPVLTSSGYVPGAKLYWRVAAVDAGSTTGDYTAAQSFTVPATATVLPPVAQCADGADNDGDGKVDYPADRGCSGASDESESPDPPLAAQCADGADNDGDGKVDYPADRGCSGASDANEVDSTPLPACRVPRVVGKTLAAARIALRRAGCSVGHLRYVRARVPRGRVTAQAPHAGRRLARGARVTLTVSRGRR
jgi:hypothetical protein